MAAALLLLLALHAQDPARVGARLTEPEVHAGETTTLRVDVETEGARAEIGRFRTLPPGIEVVGTRDYDQRQFSLPGGTRRFITREFVLRARAAGRYRIPSIRVTVEGEVYGTPSLLLTVTSAPGRERGEGRGSGDGVVLRAWLDADTVFVGEQVTLEVEAMFSQQARMGLRRAPEYEAPSPSGFWVHELPDAGRPVSRSIGDEIYEVQEFRRAFFPLSPGRYTIPPARLEYEMRRGLLYTPEARELTSDPLPLMVLPVPPGRPPAFNGAVGRYALRGRLAPDRVPVGEAAVLTVTVEGVGNVKALPAPELPDIAGVDVFPPSEEAETGVQGITVQGQKTFSWVLIPRQAGEVEIPAIRYAFFDPDRGGFETASVAPLSLRVTPATTASGDDAPPPATIRFLKTTPGSDPLAWVRAPWLGAVVALPLLMLAGALFWRRWKGREGRVTPSGLRRERKQGLRALERRAADADDRALFADAEAFARRWLADRLALNRASVSDLDALGEAGVPDSMARAVRRVLDRLSAGRYAPTAPLAAERQGMIGELRRVLEAVDGAAPARPVGRDRGGPPHGDAFSAGTRAGLLTLAVVGSLAVSSVVAAAGAAGAANRAAGSGSAAGSEVDPAGGQGGPVVVDAVQERGQAPADTLFARGLTAFENGEYSVAAGAFEVYVRRAPRDPAGWYNLGTAYYRAGSEGWGVWAWLRALELDPRDGDTRHNLRVAGVAPELVQRATPALPLRPSELLLLAALAWLLGGGAGAAWILRRRRSAGAGAVGGLVVAAVLAAVWWGSTRGPETLIVLDSATLRAGPALRSESVSTLEPGAGLVPVDRYGRWVRARTLRGEEGWIESHRTGRL
ncbi:MAG: BatD family protein [Longimicrobiales bacterium]